jgi:hypothetical protein
MDAAPDLKATSAGARAANHKRESAGRELPRMRRLPVATDVQSVLPHAIPLAERINVTFLNTVATPGQATVPEMRRYR